MNGIALVLLALAGTACESGTPNGSASVDDAGGGDPPTGAMELDPPEPGLAPADTVDIVMNDEGISPPTIRLTSGRNTVIRVRNDGTMLHELMMGREPVNGTFTVPFFRRIAADFVGPVIAVETREGAQERESAARPGAEADSLHYQLSVPLDPGEEAGIMFVPPAERRGEWLVGCTMLDHFERGERGLVIVE